MVMPADRVARIQAEWAVERPDLDPAPIGVIGRLHRLAAALTAGLVPVYAEFGLGEGDFDVLASLRRAGPPFERTPEEIVRHWCKASGVSFLGMADIGHDAANKVVPFS